MQQDVQQNVITITKKVNKNSKLIVIIGILIFLGILSLLFYKYKTSSSSSSKPTPSPVPEYPKDLSKIPNLDVPKVAVEYLTMEQLASLTLKQVQKYMTTQQLIKITPEQFSLTFFDNLSSDQSDTLFSSDDRVSLGINIHDASNQALNLNITYINLLSEKTNALQNKTVLDAYKKILLHM